MKVLVIGASGFVGSKILEYLKQEKIEADGTFTSKSQPGLRYFDLNQPDIESLQLSRYTHLVLASAMTNIDRCRKEAVLSEKINVTSSQELLSQCFENKVMPIFLSSDQVFDGREGSYSEEAETNPVNLYGTQKKRVEDFLGPESQSSLVLRLGKVVSLDWWNTFLGEWVLKLKGGQCIHAAADLITSYVTVDDVAKGLLALLKVRETGVFHLAADGEMSRWELAKRLCDQLGLSQALLKVSLINEIGLLEPRPLNTTLSNKKMKCRCGFVFQDIERIIQEIRCGN